MDTYREKFYSVEEFYDYGDYHGGEKCTHCIMTKNIELPYPPSVNRYLIRSKSGKYIKSDSHRKFLEECTDLFIKNRIVLHPAWHKYLEKSFSYHIEILSYRSDKRKRDLDNIIKPILDALCKFKLVKDDSLINVLEIRRVDKDMLLEGNLINDKVEKSKVKSKVYVSICYYTNVEDK